jgi:hypothetical protein
MYGIMNIKNLRSVTRFKEAMNILHVIKRRISKWIACSHIYFKMFFSIHSFCQQTFSQLKLLNAQFQFNTSIRWISPTHLGTLCHIKGETVCRFLNYQMPLWKVRTLHTISMFTTEMLHKKNPYITASWLHLFLTKPANCFSLKMVHMYLNM